MMNDWQVLFRTEILMRGLKYYQEGRVTELKASDSFCSAYVMGSSKYYVRIINPDKKNVHMSCNCQYAFDGNRCKHMAALMYAWENRETNTIKREPENDNPFDKPVSGQEPFYNIPVIAKELDYKKEFIKRARNHIEQGKLEMNQFDLLYSTYQYADKDNRVLARIGGSFEDDRIQGEMELIIKKNYIERYSCSLCGYSRYRPYYGYYGFEKKDKVPCEHVIGLLILADKYTRLYDPGDYTDLNAIRFLKACEQNIVQAIHENRNSIKGNVHLEPRIVEATAGLEVNFRIGNGGKMYVVKNLTSLHDNIQQRNKEELGKECTIDFATESFDEESEKLFELIEHEVRRAKALERKMENKQTYQYGGTLETGKGIPFVGGVADTIYEMYLGRKLECKFLEARKNNVLSVGTGTPRVDLRIDVECVGEKGKTTGAKVSGTIPCIVDGVKNQYFISDGEFCVLENDMKTLIRPFSRMCDNGNGEFEFYIGYKRLPDFYYNVLPRLRENRAFTITESRNIEGLIKDKAEFAFYLDAEMGMIKCRAQVSYGENTFVLKPIEVEQMPLQETRDINQELPVHQAIASLFSDYSQNENVYTIENDDDIKYEFLNRGVDLLLGYGEVHSTDAFSRMKIRRTPVAQFGIAVKSNLLDLTIKNQDISEKEFAEIMQSYKLKKKYHRLSSGEYIDLSHNESLELMLGIMESVGASVKDFTRGKLNIPVYRALYLEKMLEGHEELVASRDRNYRTLIRNFKTISDADYEIPKSLEDILRPYQKEGFKWLKTIEAAGFGGILADDMGLGKTLQVIAGLLAANEQCQEVASKEIDDGDEKTAPLHALVVCPASLVYNWIDEVEKFAPSLKAAAVSGTRAERRAIMEDNEKYDILVTSYDLLKRDIDMYEDIEFSHQIIDEAQFIKNAGSAAAKSVKLIHASHKLALTGTPIENRLSELWSIFDYLMPGFLYGYERFRKDFELPISKNKNDGMTDVLHNMIAPFVLRRKKKDVLKDLPDKLEETHVAKFEDEQQKLYDAQVSKIKGLIEDRNTDFNTSKIQILAELTKIRQICCDPSLIFENYAGSSAKREACMDLVRSAIDGGHKLLIFSQFTTMLSLLEEDIKSGGIAYYKLTGATDKEERLKMVKAYNENDVPVFLISLKAGGTGLNLTGADVVIHYDPWWNQAVQDQATDRAHRIGQQKNVTVYRLIVKNTIEEKIVELQNNKRELADAVLSGETRSIGAMTKEELMELLNV